MGTISESKKLKMTLTMEGLRYIRFALYLGDIRQPKDFQTFEEWRVYAGRVYKETMEMLPKDLELIDVPEPKKGGL